MIRSCIVVSKSLRTISSHKYRTCVTYLIKVIKGIVNTKLKMLGRQLVREVDGRLDRGDHDDLAVLVDRFSCDFRARQKRNLSFQLCADFIRQPFRTAVRTAIARFNGLEAPARIPEITKMVESSLRKQLEGTPFIVESVTIGSTLPPESVTAGITKKVEATQEYERQAIMLEIAKRSEEIAEAEGISQKYLESIMTVLSKAGFVDAVHGKGGGYRLNRAPENYTVGSILKLTEGSLAAVSCTSQGPAACSRSTCCQTKPMWDKLDTMINDFFEGITLADLLEAPQQLKL